jgi:DNA-binding response OmpR family regulator
MRPLVIIDVDDLRSAELRRSIEAAGYRAECFSNARAALMRVRARTYSLAILGLDLRDSDPLEVCSETSLYAAVIAIASECTPELCARALECGADDCVSRKTSARELVARVRSVLRRHNAGDETAFRTFSMSLSEMRVRSGDTTWDLTHGETRLLALLVEHAPTPVPVLRLCELLDARRSTMESRIKSLRRKLGPGRLISRGSLGYQLVTGDEEEKRQGLATDMGLPR